MPIFTFAIIAMNFLAFVVELAAGGDAFCQAHGLVPASFMRTGDLVPVIESAFLHDPHSLLHIGGNMLCLAIFGTAVERAAGRFTFLGVYLTAGLFGGLAHVMVNPTSTLPLVGASGAIFGVLAVAGVVRPRLLGFTVGFALLAIWDAFSGNAGAVSFAAHIGGLVAGALVVAMMRMTGNEALEVA
jgi:membrane associated rhomboid family serine protease